MMSSTRTNSRRSDHSDRKSSDHSDRSRSSSGGRTKTRTDTYSSDYSDDFDAETKSEGAATPRIQKQRRATIIKRRNPYTSNRSTIDLHSSATSRKSYAAYGNLRKKGVSRPVRDSRSAPKVKVSPNPKKNSIAKFMLTAKQQEINELQNRLFNSKQKLETAEKENKLLKTLQHRQDKAIRKFENAENELPRLISRNFEDQRVLKTKLRKTQETKRALELKLNENNEEIQKMEGVLKRLKNLVYDKNLGERSELSKQLSDAENSLMVSERKIQELEKKLDLSVGNCTRHLNAERQKHKETRERMEKLHEEYLIADSKLKEKERALNVSNIYVMRKRGSPEKALVPVKSTPRKSEISSSTQTDLALTFKPEVKGREKSPATSNSSSNFSTSPALNRLHSDASRTVRKREEKHKNSKTSIFLTTDFDSPLSSPNNTFVNETTRVSNQQDQEEAEDSFSNTLQNTEEEIKKLQIALKQKADLISRMNEIDGTMVVSTKAAEKPLQETAPKLSPKSKAELAQSLLGTDGKTNGSAGEFEFLKSSHTPVDPPKKPEREISFGSYAPTVGAIPARRKAAVGSKTTPKPVTQTQDFDEPLFDLSSGKQNKKSDLLTQLFGSQGNGVVANGDNV